MHLLRGRREINIKSLNLGQHLRYIGSSCLLKDFPKVLHHHTVVFIYFCIWKLKPNVLNFSPCFFKFLLDSTDNKIFNLFPWCYRCDLYNKYFRCYWLFWADGYLMKYFKDVFKNTFNIYYVLKPHL